MAGGGGQVDVAISSNLTSGSHSVICPMTSRAHFWLLLQRPWSETAVIPSLATLLLFIIVILAKDRNPSASIQCSEIALNQILQSRVTKLVFIKQSLNTLTIVI